MADVTDKEATRSESNMEDSRGEDRETNRENREENGDTEHGRVLGKEGPDEDGGDRYQTEQHSTEWRGAMETGVSPFEFMNKFMERIEGMDEKDLQKLYRDREEMRKKWQEARDEGYNRKGKVGVKYSVKWLEKECVMVRDSVNMEGSKKDGELGTVMKSGEDRTMEAGEVEQMEAGEVEAKKEGEVKAKEDEEVGVKEYGKVEAKEDGKVKAKGDGEVEAKEDLAVEAKEDGEVEAKEDGDVETKEDLEVEAKEDGEGGVEDGEDEDGICSTMA
ncbi:sodium/potassium/calcium exchanger 1-like [Mizuhopecten yessoensis]|uniref:sodium/potassium/calcium exchanger 1-like n=1 Tax=Mizuhopecten yessoensis TaxID=6573 RepID=UPI000B45801F|nr:sodium/potassium/calcium exchanger 1-like [Mizuhopecten yessoensis]